MKKQKSDEVFLASPVSPGQGKHLASPQDGVQADCADNDLIEAIAEGDQKAFSVLIRRYLPKMVMLANRIVLDRELAHEVAQEAFLRVWTQAPKWNPDGGASFTTWLHRIVVNLAISQRRKRRPQVDISVIENMPAQGADGFDHIVTAQEKRAVQECLQRLPERQRAALALFYFNEISQAEAAQGMDLTPKAFDSLLVRARRGLRKHLSAMGFSRGRTGA